MSLANALFYKGVDTITNKDSLGDLGEKLSNIVSHSMDRFRGMGQDESMIDLISETEDSNQILEDLRDDGRYQHRSLVDSFGDELSELSEDFFESNDTLLAGLRVSNLKVRLINAESDIVEPMSIAFRSSLLDLREELLQYHHESTMWLQRISQSVSRSADGGMESLGVVLAYKQFMRHPIWYSLHGVFKALTTVVGGTLFGFGKKKTIDERILEELKRQTNVMLRGETGRPKTLFEQFKSGGIFGLVMRDIGKEFGISVEKAQERENRRAAGEDVGKSFFGKMADKIFFDEVTRRERSEAGAKRNSIAGMTLTTLEDLFELAYSDSNIIEGEFARIDDTLNRIGMAIQQGSNNIVQAVGGGGFGSIGFDGADPEVTQFMEDLNTIVKSQRQYAKALVDSNKMSRESLSASHKMESSLSDISRTNRNMRIGSEKNEKTLIETMKEDISDKLDAVTGNTKASAKEAKKTNRRLLLGNIFKMFGMAGGMIGSVLGFLKGGAIAGVGMLAKYLPSVAAGFTKIGGLVGLLRRGLGLGVLYKSITGGLEDLQNQKGPSIMNSMSTVMGGFLVGGIKGAALAAAFEGGKWIGTWWNNNVLNPAMEWLTGEEGATLGTAIYDFFNGARDKLLHGGDKELQQAKDERENASWLRRTIDPRIASKDEIDLAEARKAERDTIAIRAMRKKEEEKSAKEDASWVSSSPIFKNMSIEEIDKRLKELSEYPALITAAAQAQNVEQMNTLSERFNALAQQKEFLERAKSGKEQLAKEFSAKSLSQEAAQRVMSALDKKEDPVRRSGSSGSWGNVTEEEFAEKVKSGEEFFGNGKFKTNSGGFGVDTSTVIPKDIGSLQIEGNSEMLFELKKLNNSISKMGDNSTKTDPFPDTRSMLNVSGDLHA